MAEKNLNTRIKLKIGTYAEWTDESVESKGANFVLKHGEIGFCEIPTGNAEATTAPTVLFKVGDGTTPFKGLKWASALAADVYAWAKKNEVKITGSGNAITGASISEDGFLTFDKGETFATVDQLEEIVGGLDADTNTKYSFSANGTHLVIKKKDVTDPDFVDYETVDIVTPDELTTALGGYYTKKQIDDKFEAIPAPIDYTVTCTDVTENIGNNIKRHTLMQNGQKVCDIDIPTDLVVVSGQVVDDPEGQEPGKYIELIIANQEEPVYINVADLIDGPIGFTELDESVNTLLERADSSLQFSDISFEKNVSGPTDETNGEYNFVINISSVGGNDSQAVSIYANGDSGIYIGNDGSSDGCSIELAPEVWTSLDKADSAFQIVGTSVSGDNRAEIGFYTGSDDYQEFAGGVYLQGSDNITLVDVSGDDYTPGAVGIDLSDSAKNILNTALVGIELTAETADIPGVTDSFDLAKIDICSLVPGTDEKAAMASLLIGGYPNSGITVDTILGTYGDTTTPESYKGVALRLTDNVQAKLGAAITEIETGTGLTVTEKESNETSKTVTLDFDDTVTFIFDCGGPA